MAKFVFLDYGRYGEPDVMAKFYIVKIADVMANRTLWRIGHYGEQDIIVNGTLWRNCIRTLWQNGCITELRP